jgi:hypothetical protein
LKNILSKLGVELTLESRGRIATSGSNRSRRTSIFNLTQDEAFHELVQDIRDEVTSRFGLVTAGELKRRPSG